MTPTRPATVPTVPARNGSPAVLSRTFQETCRTAETATSAMIQGSTPGRYLSRSRRCRPHAPMSRPPTTRTTATTIPTGSYVPAIGWPRCLNRLSSRTTSGRFSSAPQRVEQERHDDERARPRAPRARRERRRRRRARPPANAAAARPRMNAPSTTSRVVPADHRHGERQEAAMATVGDRDGGHHAESAVDEPAGTRHGRRQHEVEAVLALVGRPARDQAGARRAR